jgi:hypothetical protein
MATTAATATTGTTGGAAHDRRTAGAHRAVRVGGPGGFARRAGFGGPGAATARPTTRAGT